MTARQDAFQGLGEGRLIRNAKVAKGVCELNTARSRGRARSRSRRCSSSGSRSACSHSLEIRDKPCCIVRPNPRPPSVPLDPWHDRPLNHRLHHCQRVCQSLTGLLRFMDEAASTKRRSYDQIRMRHPSTCYGAAFSCDVTIVNLSTPIAILLRDCISALLPRPSCRLIMPS